MSAKPYVVNNEEWHGTVEQARSFHARGAVSKVPAYNGLEKRAAKYFAIYQKLKAIRCRPPAFPRVVTDSNLTAWFRATKQMVRKATGPRGVAINAVFTDTQTQMERYVIVRPTHGLPKQRAMQSDITAHLSDSIEAMHNPICGSNLGSVGWEFTGETEWPNPDVEKAKRHLCGNCYRVANARLKARKA